MPLPELFTGFTLLPFVCLRVQYTNPLQSKALGPDPPLTYAHLSLDLAFLIIDLALVGL